MAFTFTTNTFAGTPAEFLIARAFLGNELAQRGLMHVRGGIKKDLIIPKVNIQNIIQDDVATPTSSNSGDFLFTERSLSPQKYMMYVEFSPEALLSSWQFDDVEGGATLFQQLSADKQLELLNIAAMAHDEYLNKALFQNVKTGGGGTAPFNKFDGLIYKLDNASTTVKPTWTSYSTLDAENIIEALETIVAAIPAAVDTNPNLRILISPATNRLYRAALRAQTDQPLPAWSPTPQNFDKYKLEVLSGFPDNTIVAIVVGDTPTSNIWLGCNYASDQATFKVDRLANNSTLWFLQARLRMDINVPKPEEAVYGGA